MTRLDRVATVQARIGWKALTADEYVDDGHIFLATPNIKSRDIDFENVNYISTFRYEESPELKLRLGDVLLAKDGSTLGIANHVRHLPGPATVNGSIAVVRPHSVEPPFLTYWLQGQVIQGRIQELKDGMGVPHLFQQDIRKLPVPDLEPEEQRRIADFLDDRVARIDQIIAGRRDQVRLAVDARDEVFRHLTTTINEDVRSTGVNWMPWVSSHWDLPRVSHVFRTGSGSTPPATNESYYDGPIPWVNTGDIQDRRLVATARSITELARKEFSTLVTYETGSLVVAMYGQGATKGRVALLGIDACVNQACCVLRADDDLTEWAFYWFRAHKSAVVSLALGAGQPNLSQEIISALRIPIPPRGERSQILSRLRNVEIVVSRGIASMELQVRRLCEYKQALITAAVTGELDVTSTGSGIPG